MVGRTNRIYFALLIFVIFTTLVIMTVLLKDDKYLHRTISLDKQLLQKDLFATNTDLLSQTAHDSFSIAEEEFLPHRTHLISRTRCTQKLFLLIVVFTAPPNADRRNIIRKTWASDPSMKIKWKTMFLLGQARNSMQQVYLEAEGRMYNDFIRGTHRDNYRNLTLKTEMGLEWAAKYCDFQFLLKADDDVFVNPYRLIDYLSNTDTPKAELYLGYVMRNERPHREGKYGVPVEDYNKTRYPDFCSGPAYVLSSDLVHKLVEIFDVKKPLKLEDVYIGTLIERRKYGFKMRKGNLWCQLSILLAALYCSRQAHSYDLNNGVTFRAKTSYIEYHFNTTSAFLGAIFRLEFSSTSCKGDLILVTSRDTENFFKIYLEEENKITFYYKHGRWRF
ncbi:hypothetical protein ACROYT_G020405 [Oculina patagonica]